MRPIQTAADHKQRENPQRRLVRARDYRDGKPLRGDASAKASCGMTIGAKAWAFHSTRAKPIKNTSTLCAGGKKVGASNKTG